MWSCKGKDQNRVPAGRKLRCAPQQRHHTGRATAGGSGWVRRAADRPGQSSPVHQLSSSARDAASSVRLHASRRSRPTGPGPSLHAISASSARGSASSGDGAGAPAAASGTCRCRCRRLPRMTPEHDLFADSQAKAAAARRSCVQLTRALAATTRPAWWMHYDAAVDCNTPACCRIHRWEGRACPGRSGIRGGPPKTRAAGGGGTHECTTVCRAQICLDEANRLRVEGVLPLRSAG